MGLRGIVRGDVSSQDGPAGWSAHEASAYCAAAVFVAPASAGSAGLGAPELSDEYFPGYGNGGYDISRYDVRLRYQPRDYHLSGTATIAAKRSRG